MDEQTLRKLYPNASESFIRANCPSYRGNGTRPVVQEQQADQPKPQDRKTVPSHQRPEKGVDGKRHPQFRVSITWLVSDNRVRDAWGMSETVADCIVSAVRRFLGLDDPRRAKRPARAPRVRGGGDND